MMISLSFGLGYIMAEFKSIQPNEHTAPNTHHERYTDQLIPDPSPYIQSADPSSHLSAQVLIKQQLPHLNKAIEQASIEKISHYLDQAFPKADLSDIHDKKKFAQRLINEFSQSENDQQDDLIGQVIISTQQHTPEHITELNQIHKQQQLFAHLDTLNKLNDNRQIFIRWIDRQTGEVLLFLPQNISANKQQNWVSFTPVQGWKSGTYDVRYYQMKDDLKPIAQTTYRINTVNE